MGVVVRYAVTTVADTVVTVAADIAVVAVIGRVVSGEKGLCVGVEYTGPTGHWYSAVG